MRDKIDLIDIIENSFKAVQNLHQIKYTKLLIDVKDEEKDVFRRI